MPPTRTPAGLSPMQVRNMLAQARDHVADIGGARAFGGEPFLERGDLVDEMG